mmetsp:Transcript_39241/g.116736  ORF Transcript_39241/g.116736 Transcript_39241/m.116736 type:complete len:91 (+) Transcript_39241:1887-2159(+)
MFASVSAGNGGLVRVYEAARFPDVLADDPIPDLAPSRDAVVGPSSLLLLVPPSRLVVADAPNFCFMLFNILPEQPPQRVRGEPARRRHAA